MNPSAICYIPFSMALHRVKPVVEDPGPMKCRDKQARKQRNLG